MVLVLGRVEVSHKAIGHQKNRAWSGDWQCEKQTSVIFSGPLIILQLIRWLIFINIVLVFI